MVEEKKRILVLNYEFPPLGGGASSVSYEISKGLVKLGHSVDVVTMGFKDLPSFEVVDGINVYRVKCLRSKKEMCSPHEQLTYLFSAMRFLRKHMKENSYDICHCHFIDNFRKLINLDITFLNSQKIVSKISNYKIQSLINSFGSLFIHKPLFHLSHIIETSSKLFINEVSSL